MAYKEKIYAKWAEFVPSSNHAEILPKALQVKEIETLLNTVENADTAQAPRDSLLINLLYSSGLRISEALNLEISHIDEQKQILLITGKGSKERLVPYSERSSRALKKYLTTCWEEWKGSPQQEILFISHRSKKLTRMGAWKCLQRWSLLAGLDPLHPHVLRHSFATHLLAGGADIRIVQSLLGHSSINTTERYLKIDDQDLKKLFHDFHPLENN